MEKQGVVWSFHVFFAVQIQLAIKPFCFYKQVTSNPVRCKRESWTVNNGHNTAWPWLNFFMIFFFLLFSGLPLIDFDEFTTTSSGEGKQQQTWFSRNPIISTKINMSGWSYMNISVLKKNNQYQWCHNMSFIFLSSLLFFFCNLDVRSYLMYNCICL